MLPTGRGIHAIGVHLLSLGGDRRCSSHWFVKFSFLHSLGLVETLIPCAHSELLISSTPQILSTFHVSKNSFSNAEKDEKEEGCGGKTKCREEKDEEYEGKDEADGESRQPSEHDENSDTSDSDSEPPSPDPIITKTPSPAETNVCRFGSAQNGHGKSRERCSFWSRRLLGEGMWYEFGGGIEYERVWVRRGR